jgi:hypothetical protein
MLCSTSGIPLAGSRRSSQTSSTITLPFRRTQVNTPFKNLKRELAPKMKKLVASLDQDGKVLLAVREVPVPKLPHVPTFTEVHVHSRVCIGGTYDEKLDTIIKCNRLVKSGWTCHEHSPRVKRTIFNFEMSDAHDNQVLDAIIETDKRTILLEGLTPIARYRGWE